MTWNTTLCMRKWHVIKSEISQVKNFISHRILRSGLNTSCFDLQQADVIKSVNSLNRNQLRVHLQFRYRRHEHTLNILRGSSFEIDQATFSA